MQRYTCKLNFDCDSTEFQGAERCPISLPTYIQALTPDWGMRLLSRMESLSMVTS